VDSILNWNDKKVLITGAAGFIGFNLLRRFVHLNAQVVAIDNFSAGKPIETLSKMPVNIINADVSYRKTFDALPRDIDYIFHFGAPSSIILFNKDPVFALSTTICGLNNVFEFAKSVGAKKVVYPSSGSVYGTAPAPQSEHGVTKPTNLYGITKLTCEKIAAWNFDLIPSVGLRIFAGFGPGEEHKGDYASVVTIFLNCMLRNERPVIFGDGTQNRDFVYIDDVVNAIVKSAEKPISNTVVNVGTGKNLKFNDVVEIINNVLKKNIQPVYVAKPEKYFDYTLADTSKMHELLGVNARSPEEGIKEYISHLSSSSGCIE
jgi:nucleoside-diphosphate-sugar epimerase